MSDKDFNSDECGNKFCVGQGFLGSLDDFEFQMSDRETRIDDFECSPFMSYVQLCNDCYTKRIEGSDELKKTH